MDKLMEFKKEVEKEIVQAKDTQWRNELVVEWLPGKNQKERQHNQIWIAVGKERIKILERLNCRLNYLISGQ